MAVDRKQQMKEIKERLEQGVKDNFYIGNVHDVPAHDGKIPQLQFQQYVANRYAAA